MLDNGKLTNAWVDNCENYTPDKKQPVGISSWKSGMLYKCTSFEYSPEKDSKGFYLKLSPHCVVCKNRLEVNQEVGPKIS